jgi:hypothetical protein
VRYDLRGEGRTTCTHQHGGQMKEGETTMSREVQLSIRMTFGERLEAKVMAEALGLTLDGFVKEALDSQYRKHATLYEQMRGFFSTRAEKFLSKNIARKTRKNQG